MRKTKIVCTMGPSTDKPGILRQLMENGMNVARFNFSHGDYEEHKGRYDKVRALSRELDLPIACMLDTKGPEIRLGEFKNGVEKLTTGQKFTLTSRSVEGTNEICSVTYKELPHDVKPGGRIMLDDGLIELRIDEVGDTDIACTVCNDGIIKTKKGVNVPGVHLSMPYMSAQDRADIRFGIEEGFDFIAASFCRTAQDAMEIRRMLDENHSNMRIIAKLENQEGVNNVDEILAVVDGVMIARGAQGNPWIFSEMIEHERTGRIPSRPTNEEIRKMMLRHAKLQLQYKGEYLGIREMRKHVAWYTKGLPGSAKLREEINRVESYAELEDLLYRQL